MVKCLKVRNQSHFKCFSLFGGVKLMHTISQIHTYIAGMSVSSSEYKCGN